ncbi:U-box domain-containing protein 16-like [Wolffia australiana]
MATPPREDASLLRSLLRLSTEISLFDRRWNLPPQRQKARAIARKSKILSFFFEEILSNITASLVIPSWSSIRCLTDILDLLRRLRDLMNACSLRMSRIGLILGLETVSKSFHAIDCQLSKLMSVFALSDLGLGDDFGEMAMLICEQCRRSSPAVDPEDERLRDEILQVIRETDQGIVLDCSRIAKPLKELGLSDSQLLGYEIQRLKAEIANRVDPERTAAMTKLLGVVLYFRCVESEEFSSKSDLGSDAASDTVVPVDLRCPITLDVMRDPVVVSSGQTYERESIASWIASEHATCPKTGQTLSHCRLIPNKALRNVIRRRSPLHVDDSEAPPEATKTTILLLVNKLVADPTSESRNRIVRELRRITKSSPENRASAADAGAVAVLVSLLTSDDASLQDDAMAALLNLSVVPSSKKLLMLFPGGLEGVIGVLKGGLTWSAKENAAGTLLSVSSQRAEYRRKVAMSRGAAEGLAELVRRGPASGQRDGLLAMLQMAGDEGNIRRLVDGGAVAAALEATAVPEAAEMALAVVAAVARRGGAADVAGTRDSVTRLAGALKGGTARARETAAAALVSVCADGGAVAAAELAAVSGMDSAIRSLMWSGSERGRRTAASLCRFCRR